MLIIQHVVAVVQMRNLHSCSLTVQTLMTLVYPELTIPIKAEWLNKPLSKDSYFITHLVQQFNVDEVMGSYNLFLKAAFFEGIVNQIVDNIIWKEE